MFRMTMAILLMLVSHALGQPVEDASQNRMVPMPNSLDIKMPYLKLFVDKKTLPAGPFLGYDTNGKLVATVYMIPLGDLGVSGNSRTSLRRGRRSTTSISGTIPATSGSRRRIITSFSGM